MDVVTKRTLIESGIARQVQQFTVAQANGHLVVTLAVVGRHGGYLVEENARRLLLAPGEAAVNEAAAGGLGGRPDLVEYACGSYTSKPKESAHGTEEHAIPDRRGHGLVSAHPAQKRSRHADAPKAALHCYVLDA